MTTNGVRDFPSIPDTLPPKKRNSRENLNQAPTEPVFKTPSVFWNQSSFKRTRRSRELGSGSFLDLHSASTYYSQWPDVHQTFPHPVWDGRSYPSLAQRVANTVPLSNLNRNYPIMVHGFYQPSWGYVGAESRDVYDKSYGSIHNRQESKVIKPVPVYTTEAAKGEMGRLFGGESLANLSKESGINQDSGPSMEHRDIPRTVYDSKCYDLLQTCTNRTENLQQQNQTSTIRQQFKRSERMKGNYLPLVVSKGSAETQQLESGIFSLQVLSRFVEGSLIELEGGRLKRVENLEMKDFECCTESCQEFRLKKFCVQKISGSGTPGCVCLEVELEDEHSQISLEVCEVYPFFVCDRGWSSCHPERTAQLCYLRCHQLHLGDVCLALTPMLMPPDNHTLTLPDPGDQESVTEKTTEVSKVSRPGKIIRRHHSAPELTNVL